MKITLSRLTEIVRGIVKEAAKEGEVQKFLKKQMNKRIATASTGGNKNTPPFTKKAAKAGKSGLGPF
tara:strand:+ start:1334 stop:1534 length:201 start_codon:yes stop_codon:yes gene_type:complete